jgi:hypothetical protein
MTDRKRFEVHWIGDAGLKRVAARGVLATADNTLVNLPAAKFYPFALVTCGGQQASTEALVDLVSLKKHKFFELVLQYLRFFCYHFDLLTSLEGCCLGYQDISQSQFYRLSSIWRQLRRSWSVEAQGVSIFRWTRSERCGPSQHNRLRNEKRHSRWHDVSIHRATDGLLVAVRNLRLVQTDFTSPSLNRGL